MSDRKIDEILKGAAQTPPDLDPALLDRIAGSISSSCVPVRPLPPAGILAGGLFLICAAIALGGAAFLGLRGFQNLSGVGRALILPAVGILIWLASRTYVSEMIPGSRKYVTPGFLLLAGSAGLIALFVVIFRDYRTDAFVSQGLTCLIAGLVHAIPMALASWLILRRGFAVNPSAAGLVAGTLSGLAGVAMLELHCANFQTMHVILWHTAVMLVSAGAGALIAWLLRSRASSSVR